MNKPSLGMTVIGGLVLAGLSAGVASAGNSHFDDFTPLASSAGPTANEAAPITFGNAAIQQRSIADRTSQLAAGEPNSGNWDMITTNETGPHKGSVPPHPVRDRPVRHSADRPRTGETETIWYSPSNVSPSDHVAFDASYWTPWGTYITAEESWCSAPAGCTTSPYGRFFELTNPLTADSVTDAGWRGRRARPPQRRSRASRTRVCSSTSA